MFERLGEIHELLNFIWGTVIELNEELREELKPQGFRVDLVEGIFNGYVFLDGEWKEMKYPYPAFEIKPQGEIGATIQGFYIVFEILKDKVNKEFLEEFLLKFPKSYIYGGPEDVYNHRTKPVSYKEIFEAMKESDENVFNFEVEVRDFENPKETVRRELRKFIELLKKYELLDFTEED